MRATLAVVCVLAACGSERDDGFPGLGADVDIVVDDMGIPHVYGASDPDVFFAAGYQMATDRLFQMDLTRRRALGRRAEVGGAGFFEDDRIARLFDWTRLGRDDAAGLRAARSETWAAVEAWVAGVNRRIADVNAGAAPLPYGFGAGPGELDYRPEPWDVADPLVIGKMINFANENLLEQELFLTLLAKLQPETFATIDLLTPMYDVFTLPEEERPAPGAAPAPAPLPAPIHAGDDDLRATLRALHRLYGDLRVSGSNNFAVAGQHTANGRPLIGNDPHQPIESPSLMYALHLSSADRGGTLDVIGFSFVGTPGVQLGHNRDLVWTATTSFGDTMDVWEVEDLGTAVRVAGEDRPVALRHEPIVLRGEDQPIDLVIVDVPGLGVLLPDDLAPIRIAGPGRALLFRWQGAVPRSPRELIDYDRAATLDEFARAVDDLGAGFNFVAADASGILYRVAQQVPDRGPPAGRPAPWLVMDGDDASAQWTGAVLPPERLPSLRDPARGWVTTANNDPFGFTANGRVDDDPWYYGGLFDPGFRARRLDDELARLVARGDVTEQDLHALQTSVDSPLAAELVPLVEAAVQRIDTDEALAAYRGREDLPALAAHLAAWDRRMARDSSAAVVFRAWLHLLAEGVFAEELSPFFPVALELGGTFVLKMTARTILERYDGAAALMPEGRDLLVVDALARASDWLTTRFGGWDPSLYTYGDVHGTAFVGPVPTALDLPFVASDGAEDTINVSPSTFLDDAGDPAPEWLGHDGALFRLVATFDDDGTPVARVAFAPGQHADPASAHFDDLLAGWVDGTYQPLRFRRADVDAAVESRVVLPAGTR